MQFDGRIVYHIREVLYLPIRLPISGHNITGNQGLVFNIAASCSDINMIEEFFVFKKEASDFTILQRMTAGKYSYLIAHELNIIRKLS